MTPPLNVISAIGWAKVRVTKLAGSSFVVAALLFTEPRSVPSGAEGRGGAGGEAEPGDVEEGDGADRLAEIDLGAAAGGVVGQGARGEQGRLAGGEDGPAGEAGTWYVKLVTPAGPIGCRSRWSS